MRKYYFVANLCPPLSLESKPEITFGELMDIFDINLSEEDKRQVDVLRLFIDIYNLRAFWMNVPLDPRGRYSKSELEEFCSLRIGLPDYVLDFLQLYDDAKDRIKAFPILIDRFFQEESKQATGFLKRYLDFERDWRIVMAGFRAKKLERDLLKELPIEEETNDVLAQVLAQKDAKVFEPPSEYEDLGPLFEKYSDEPLALQKALSEYRFNKVESLKGESVFKIDALLAYMVQLIIVEKWQEALEEKGVEIVDRMVKGIA